MFLFSYPNIPNIYNNTYLFFYLFIVSIFLYILTVVSNGLELAVGLHLANNLYGAILVTPEGTVFGANPIYTTTFTGQEFFISLLTLIPFSIMLIYSM